jgi:hypothetical protein
MKGAASQPVADRSTNFRRIIYFYPRDLLLVPATVMIGGAGMAAFFDQPLASLLLVLGVLLTVAAWSLLERRAVGHARALRMAPPAEPAQVTAGDQSGWYSSIGPRERAGAADDHAPGPKSLHHELPPAVGVPASKSSKPRRGQRQLTAGPTFDAGSRASRAPWRVPSGIYQAGVSADAATIGDLDIRAASVVGPSHRCEEPAAPRQDAYLITQTIAGDYALICVADGVSSSENSEVGARIAVNAATREMLDALNGRGNDAGLDANKIFHAVAGEIVGTAKNRKSDPDQYCTILAAAVLPTRPAPDGSRTMWCAQIGDISLWSRTDDGFQQLTGTVKAGLDRNNLSAVLPHHPQAVTVSTPTLAAGAVIALVTDGLGDLFEDIPAAPQFFSTSWRTPPVVPQMVHDLSFDAPGQQDDRTAVVVWCGTVSKPMSTNATDRQQRRGAS